MPSDVAPALFKAVVGLSYDVAGYWFIQVDDPAGGKVKMCINHNRPILFSQRMGFARWAASRFDNAAQPIAMLTPSDEESLLDAENAPLLDETEIDRIFKALTNGVGEIPYAQEDVIDLGDGGVDDSCGWSIYSSATITRAQKEICSTSRRDDSLDKSNCHLAATRSVLFDNTSRPIS